MSAPIDVATSMSRQCRILVERLRFITYCSFLNLCLASYLDIALDAAVPDNISFLFLAFAGAWLYYNVKELQRATVNYKNAKLWLESLTKE